jgi:hypothetical protein
MQEKIFKAQLALLPLFQITDFISTAGIISQGKEEGNPIVKNLIDSHGIWSLALIKLLVCVPAAIWLNKKFSTAGEDPISQNLIETSCNFTLIIANTVFALVSIGNAADYFGLIK